MPRLTVVCCALLLAVTTLAAPFPCSAAPADGEGWPDTRVGTLARGWVEAFGTSEAAMKDFIAKHLAAESLAKKPVNQRVELYRDLREKYGKLALTEVVKSAPNELTVKLMSSDATTREFVFLAQSQSPYKLVSVSIKERVAGMHGMFEGFHH